MRSDGEVIGKTVIVDFDGYIPSLYQTVQVLL
jgi:hypothetical protein